MMVKPYVSIFQMINMSGKMIENEMKDNQERTGDILYTLDLKRVFRIRDIVID